MSSLISSNPNATVSAAGTGIAALIVYLLSRFAGVQLGQYYAVLIAGVVSSGILLLGKEGVAGVTRLILHGRGDTGGPSTPSSPPASK